MILASCLELSQIREDLLICNVDNKTNSAMGEAGGMGAFLKVA